MTDCERFLRHIQLYFEGPLHVIEWHELFNHNRTCPDCKGGLKEQNPLTLVDSIQPIMVRLPNSCLSEDSIRRCIARELAHGLVRLVINHLRGCRKCATIKDQLVLMHGPIPED